MNDTQVTAKAITKPNTRPLALSHHSGDNWTAANGDCVELMQTMPDSSVHLTVTSIPFSSLFTYSASDHDFGNVNSDTQFFGQFAFFVKELLRVTIPGRIAAVHCMILPTSKTRDGIIGLKDFRGAVVQAFQDGGWIFHSETCIRKSPVVAVQRTKALGLLHKQLKKDSCMSRTGIADYLLAFRRPLAEQMRDEITVGEMIEELLCLAANHYVVAFRKNGINPEPVTHTNETYPVEKWQQVAEPVWHDIDQTVTLSGRSVREETDEAHLCTLQTQVIERCIELWSNENDVVFDPFGGIGSTPAQAVKMKRKGVMCELKPNYYNQAIRNLANAEKVRDNQMSLFDYGLLDDGPALGDEPDQDLIETSVD